MVGKTISHYKITEKLGAGGMGVVYKAQDLKLDRFVALKFLPPHLTTSEEEKQRFIHEAKAASALQHNNICNIHEIDETEDGQLFICMDYYEGETLDKRIKEKPLPIDRAIDIAIQIAQGLAKAHEKEIVHRDIKPANIMLTADGVVKILDFGLAKLSAQTKLTKEGTTLGTIHYMSPEQTRGESVGHRSDIWSLGVILYEMLTGKLAFKGDYDQAVIYGITNDQPEPLTGLRTGIPLDLERIVNRCISKDPQDRYQHADDLLSELNKLKKDTDLEISQLKPKGPKKKRISIIIPSIFISILVLIIMVYLVLKPFQGDKKEFSASKWENSIAVLPFTDLSQDKDQEYFCVGMTDKILTSLSKLKVLKVIPRTSVMQYKKTEKTIPEIGRELQVENVLEGSIFKAGERIRVTAQLISTSSHAHLWADDYELNYEDIFDIQDDISEKIATALLTTLSPEEKKDIKTIRPSSTEAYEYYLRGRHVHLYKFWDSGAKEDVFLTSEKMLKTAIKLDPEFADSYASLVDLYNSYYHSLPDTASERDKYMQLQEAYLDTAYQLDPNSAEVNYVKGWIHEAKNEHDEAFNSFKKALKANPNHGQNYQLMTIFFVDRGCLRLAMRCCTQAIKINPVDWEPYYGRARINMILGELADAENDFTTVLDIETNVEIKNYYWYLYVFKKQYEKAREYLSQLKAEHPEHTFFKFAQAILHAIDGQKDKALSTFKSENWRHKAVIFSLLDMKDESIGVIQKRFEYHRKNQMSRYLVLRYHPLLDNIRSDPRFQEILTNHKEIYEENLEKYGDIEELLN